jgi:predicted ArsR family transcriptional regulator
MTEPVSEPTSVAAVTDEKALPKRDQVLELLKEGTYTREEMATKLGMSVASVNSQFTYLRWMGKFIKYDEAKKLSLCTEAEFEAWEATKKSATKASTAKPKTPTEAYAAMKKALEADTKNRDAWVTKFGAAKTAFDANSTSEDARDTMDEAAAMVTLLSLKVKRGQIKFNATPVPAPEPEVVVTPETITETVDDDMSLDDKTIEDDELI